jgi:hypothetical protein
MGQLLTEPEKDMLTIYRMDTPFWSDHQELADLAEDVCREAIEDARQTTVDEKLAAWLRKNEDSGEARWWSEFECSRRAA